MGFGKSILFFYKALLFGIATVVAIPREKYKHFLIYGFIFGAIGDVVVILIVHSLNGINYLNMGPFNILGLFPYWTPIAWMFALMLFLYFLPRRKLFLYPYVVGFSFFGYSLGLALQNLGLFEYVGNYIYYAPLVITAWFGLSAFAYLKSESILLK